MVPWHPYLFGPALHCRVPCRAESCESPKAIGTFLQLLNATRVTFFSVGLLSVDACHRHATTRNGGQPELTTDCRGSHRIVIVLVVCQIALNPLPRLIGNEGIPIPSVRTTLDVQLGVSLRGEKIRPTPRCLSRRHLGALQTTHQTPPQPLHSVYCHHDPHPRSSSSFPQWFHRGAL